MAFTNLLGACSDLYTAKDPPHDGVYRVALLGFSSQSVVRKAHRVASRGARKLTCRVGQIAHVRRYEVPDPGLSGEWETGRPVVLDHLERELRQEASAPAQVDAGRQPLTARKLFDAQGQALQEDLGVGAQELGDLPVLVR